MKVVVGMSGGVDSSVAAYILKEKGYEVIGLFMQNWIEENDDGFCSAEADYNDVRRVCDRLSIPYYNINLSKIYMERVFKTFVDEYNAGRTPNPDVLCNREIKFGPFKEYAKSLGADFIATGHYAGVEEINGVPHLLRAKDENKDQTYFLNQITGEQLKNVMFPLYDLNKSEVRDIAKKLSLSTAEKKDSTGLCFIGERDFRKFLSNYIPMREGNIMNLKGEVLGTHNGVFYYTVGQRKGFGLGGGGNGEPYYVVGKDIKNNILYVNQGDCDILYSKALVASNFNFISFVPEDGKRVLLRIRHRQPLVKATLKYLDDGNIKLIYDEPIRAVAVGQYAVIYDNRICLGGGVVQSSTHILD